MNENVHLSLSWLQVVWLHKIVFTWKRPRELKLSIKCLLSRISCVTPVLNSLSILLLTLKTRVWEWQLFLMHCCQLERNEEFVFHSSFWEHSSFHTRWNKSVHFICSVRVCLALWGKIFPCQRELPLQKAIVIVCSPWKINWISIFYLHKKITKVQLLDEKCALPLGVSCFHVC